MASDWLARLSQAVRYLPAELRVRRGMALRVSAWHDESSVRLGVPEAHPSMFTGVGHVDEVLSNANGEARLPARQHGGGSASGPKSAVSSYEPDC